MDEVDDFLAHYGVKGMRWGKRKNSSGARQIAVPKAAKLKPELSPAEKKAKNRKLVRDLSIAAAGLAYATPILKEFGGIMLDHAVMAKKQSNGRKHAERLFSDQMGITNYSTIRLHQNPTTGNWV